MTESFRNKAEELEHALKKEVRLMQEFEETRPSVNASIEQFLKEQAEERKADET